MVFVVPKYNIVYAPVPKAACTSLKKAMYELENGVPFTGLERNGRTLGIQDAFPSDPFDPMDFAQLESQFKFAVLRDPASRVLATWSNRVMQHKRLEVFNRRIAKRRGRGFKRIAKRVLGRAGDTRMLNPFPTANEFALNIKDYYDIYLPVSHHTASVTHFLGDDLSIYDRIYTMKDIPALEDDIRELTGVLTFSIPKSNKSPSEIKVTIDDLSDEAFATLISWLEPEYELLSKWFTPPTRDIHTLKQTGTN